MSQYEPVSISPSDYDALFNRGSNINRVIEESYGVFYAVVHSENCDATVSVSREWQKWASTQVGKRGGDMVDGDAVAFVFTLSSA